jgi:hypothetical protein
MSQTHVHETPATENVNPGRDAQGRFTAGNGGGPGNPFGRRLAAMRQAVMKAVTADDIEALLRKLLEQALSGDLAAAKLVLQYAVGKPKPVSEPDRVEAEAWEIEQGNWTDGTDMQKVLTGLPVVCATVTADALADVRRRQYKHRLDHPEEYEEKPLTPEELEEKKREFYEMNARFEAEMAARAEAERRTPSPSSAAANGNSSNGHRPSNAKTNGHAARTGVTNCSPLSSAKRGRG